MKKRKEKVNIKRIYARALFFFCVLQGRKNKKVIKRIGFWLSGTIISASERFAFVAG